jgi:DNA-binding NarL/FixJ family response regulator
MARMDKILIADDHPLVRGALALSVEAAFGRIEILECASFAELVERLEKSGIADLALLDLLMPGVNGFDGLLTMRARFPETPVVIISALEDKHLVDEAIVLGAAGFIPKSTPRQDIVAALHRVAAGEIYIPAEDRAGATAMGPPAVEDVEIAQKLSTLTTQQLRVLRLLGTGKLNKEIAYELDIAEPTVKVHVSAILQKLKVYSRTQAVVVAGRLLSSKVLEETGRGRFSRERTSA